MGSRPGQTRRVLTPPCSRVQHSRLSSADHAHQNLENPELFVPAPHSSTPSPITFRPWLSHSVTQAPEPWNHAPDVERSVGSPGETARWGLVRLGCRGRCFIAAAPLVSRAYTEELYLIRSLWRESSLLHASPRSRSTGAGNHYKGSRRGGGDGQEWMIIKTEDRPQL